MDFDWDPPKRFEIQPGTYLLEVIEVHATRSKKKPGGKGDERMLMVTFRIKSGAARDAKLDDYFMLEGKGLGLTQRKLVALGIERGKAWEPSSLIGLRAWAALIEERKERSDGKGEFVSIRIDANAEGSEAGLWPEDAPPPGIDGDTPKDPFADEGALDDVPF